MTADCAPADVAPTGHPASTERLDDPVELRRHALLECMLHDLLGVDWSQVHIEAERWEGPLTDAVEARLVATLGDPGTCPHGNPIPFSGNAPDQSDAIRLVDSPIGDVEVVRITEALEADADALRRLAAAGLVPGRPAEVLASDDDGVQLVGATADATLARAVAAEVWVRPAA